MPRVIGFPKLKQLMRRVASIDIDKSKAEDLIEIIEKKFRDLIEVAERNARENGREIIYMRDLPLTKGFLSSMEERKKLLLTAEVDLSPILAVVAEVTPYTVSDELRENLQDVVGALIYIIGKAIRLLESSRRPSKETLEKVEKLLDLTL